MHMANNSTNIRSKLSLETALVGGNRAATLHGGSLVPPPVTMPKAIGVKGAGTSYVKSLLNPAAVAAEGASSIPRARVDPDK